MRRGDIYFSCPVTPGSITARIIKGKPQSAIFEEIIWSTCNDLMQFIKRSLVSVSYLCIEDKNDLITANLSGGHAI